MLNIYKINNNKFKSIYFSFNFTMNVNEKENSQNPVLASLLSKSCEKYKSEKEIQKYLYSLYGAVFDVNVEKYGDLYNIEFLLECVNKNFLPGKEDIVDGAIDFMYNMICKPNIVNNSFDGAIVEREKLFILERIKARKDDKLKYGVIKAEELLCYPDAFGMYLYGDEKIVEDIKAEELYSSYQNLISNSCITAIVSGNLDGYEDIEERIQNKFSGSINSKLTYTDLNFDENKKIKNEDIVNETKEIQETSQSVLSLGLRVKNATENDFFALNVYNSILGATPSSKLFQNFREKESLAYTVRSRYYRFKSILVIYAGIENDKYQKAKEVLLKELDDMKKGNITDDEFNSSKKSLVSDLEELYDSRIALSKMLLANLIFYKNNEVTLDNIIEGINKVTLDDVINVASKIKLEEIFLLGGGELG